MTFHLRLGRSSFITCALAFALCHPKCRRSGPVFSALLLSRTTVSQRNRRQPDHLSSSGHSGKQGIAHAFAPGS